MQFSYYKTANRTASCSAVMPFCRWLWCGLCGLVNTPISTFKRYLGPWLLSKFREDSTLSHS